MHAISVQESSRVSAICFHPKRSYVLYGTEKGTIRMVDYESGTIVLEISISPDRVRCLAIHHDQPFFAIGTENGQIHVYDYKTKHLLFTLDEHLQYVSSLDFHVEYPILTSTSGDGTSRLFNWQSRVCIALVDSEIYPVNCARISPTQPLLVSGLSTGVCHMYSLAPIFAQGLSKEIGSSLFGEKTIADEIWNHKAHDDRISDVRWHSRDALFATCSYDGTVKLWNMPDSVTVTNVRVFKANSDSPILCGGFHRISGLFGAVSADGVFQLWNPNTGKLFGEYKQPTKFACLALNNSSALAAIGRSDGMSVLKMWKERPFYDSVEGTVTWIKGNQLVIVDTLDKKNQRKMSLYPHARKVSLCPSTNAVVVSYDVIGKQSGIVEYIDLTKEKPRQKWIGNSGVYFSRTQIAALTMKKDKIMVLDPTKTTVKKVKIPRALTLFAANPGCVFIATEKELLLYDIYRGEVLASAPMGYVKSVVYNKNRTKIAAFSSSTVYCANADLTGMKKVREQCKVKSICWFDGIIVYSTRKHLKYFVDNEIGIMMSMPKVCYLVHGSSSGVWFVARDGTAFQKKLQFDEIRIVKGICRGDSELCARVVEKHRTTGNFVFDLAKRKNQFDTALVVAHDHKSRFEMAIGAGNCDIAFEEAKHIDNTETWKTLAREATKYGRFTIAEFAWKKAKDVNELMMLYLISGEQEKLMELGKTSTNFMHMLWTNDNDRLKAIPHLFDESYESTMSVSTGASVLMDWPMLGSEKVARKRGKLLDIAEDEEEEAAAWGFDEDLEAEMEPEEEEEEAGSDWDFNAQQKDAPQAPPAPEKKQEDFLFDSDSDDAYRRPVVYKRNMVD